MKTLLFMASLLVVNVALANDSGGFLKEVSWTERSESRVAAGFTPFDGSSTDIAVLFADDGWDFSIWGAFENDNDLTLNESDIGFGYTFRINDSWSTRMGMTEWIFPEGKEHYLLQKDLSYSGAVNVNFEVIHSLTDSGTQYSLTLSTKPTPMDSFMGGSFFFIPSIEAVCVDEFFGMTGCSSNVTYQGLVSGTWEEKWGLDLSLSYQDGRDWGAEEDFDNAWVFWAKFRRFF